MPFGKVIFEGDMKGSHKGAKLFERGCVLKPNYIAMLRVVDSMAPLALCRNSTHESGQGAFSKKQSSTFIIKKMLHGLNPKNEDGPFWFQNPLAPKGKHMLTRGAVNAATSLWYIASVEVPSDRRGVLFMGPVPPWLV